MNITKKQFVAAMGAIRSQQKRDDGISNSLSEVCGERVPFFGGGHGLAGLMKLLKELTRDECSWIEYFIYDMDYGKKWKPSSITIDGKSVSLKTSSDLYNVLSDNWRHNVTGIR